MHWWAFILGNLSGAALLAAGWWITKVTPWGPQQ